MSNEKHPQPPSEQEPSRPSSKRYLLIDDQGKAQPIYLDVITIGSHPLSDIRLAGEGVRRYHARLVRTPEGYAIEDYSRGTTLVDGEIISAAPLLLQEGQHLAFGRAFSATYAVGFWDEKRVQVSADPQTSAQTLSLTELFASGGSDQVGAEEVDSSAEIEPGWVVAKLARLDAVLPGGWPDRILLIFLAAMLIAVLALVVVAAILFI